MNNDYMIRRCPTTTDLINSGRVSVIITILTLCLWNNGRAQPCVDQEGQFSWDQVNWPDGQAVGRIKVGIVDSGDSVVLNLSISTAAQGSFQAFGVQTPYVDGRRHWHFGIRDDLGIMFDPEPAQGASPVIIEATFSSPVSCLSFEISDIDVSGSKRGKGLVCF